MEGSIHNFLMAYLVILQPLHYEIHSNYKGNHKNIDMFAPLRVFPSTIYKGETIRYHHLENACFNFL